ncbi:hypothetical protein [Methylocapsa aurea]|nr:hypothetical protein [Methylocapsa aurea]
MTGVEAGFPPRANLLIAPALKKHSLKVMTLMSIKAYMAIDIMSVSAF